MQHLILAILLVISFESIAQKNKSGDSINLISNGNFEKGNIGFASDFEFNSTLVLPGQYSITKNASLLNLDFENPKRGDHTSGKGWFMVVNSNDQTGEIAWKIRVKVIPNSVYHFSVYFCNVYKKQNSNFGLMVNGIGPEISPIGNDPNLKVTINKTIVIEDERDRLHAFGWLRAEAEWYSGTASGEVDIWIENKNPKSLGNDLALDDITFYYVKTMPPGYKPPVPPTEMSAEYRESERSKKVEDPRKVILVNNNVAKGDSIAPGIYSITRTNKRNPVPVFREQKFQPILFEQAKFELTANAKVTLDSLADYLLQRPSLNIQLRGYTENIGNKELNLKLSEDRAITVKTYLINKGVAQERIETQGYGGTNLVENKQSEEYRQLNRRVEIEIISSK